MGWVMEVGSWSWILGVRRFGFGFGFGFWARVGTTVSVCVVVDGQEERSIWDVAMCRAVVWRLNRWK
jgi:hypothetical protein